MLLIRSALPMATNAEPANGSSRSPNGPLGARSSAAHTNDIVVVKELRKSFGDQEVLKGIDIVCRRNETTCVVGGSGAGKTTLLRLIVALDRPTGGHIYID